MSQPVHKSPSWKERIGLGERKTDGHQKTVTATFDVEVRAGITQAPVDTPPGAVVTPTSPPYQGPVQCAVAALSRVGQDTESTKTNQDSWLMAWQGPRNAGPATSILWGVMDGHGPHGHLVSAHIRAQLPAAVALHVQGGKAPEHAMHHGFVEVDASARAAVDCSYSGSTAVLSMLCKSTLHTGWVGDSKVWYRRKQVRGPRQGDQPQAVLGSQPSGSDRIQAIALTVDHKPDVPEERARIEAHHGRVERLQDETGVPLGPFRVWFADTWAPGLAMSRAIGDALAKECVRRVLLPNVCAWSLRPRVGVVAEPQHSSVVLTPADRFLLLASDGVWEFVTPQQAVDLVGGCASPQEACTKLVEEAQRRWQAEEEGVADDITAVVVFFQHNATSS